MATVRVHQDLFNYEVKRYGFTKRQIGCFALGIAACAGVAMTLTGLGVGWRVASIVGFCALVPVICAGFMPVWGMPFEEALARYLALKARGGALTMKQESAQIEGVLSGSQKKRTPRGYECTCAKDTRRREKESRERAGKRQ